jgi:hypothetical protein
MKKLIQFAESIANESTKHSHYSQSGTTTKQRNRVNLTSLFFPQVTLDSFLKSIGLAKDTSKNFEM